MQMEGGKNMLGNSFAIILVLFILLVWRISKTKHYRVKAKATRYAPRKNEATEPFLFAYLIKTWQSQS